MSLRLRILGAVMRLTVRNSMRFARDPLTMRRHMERGAKLFFRTPRDTCFEESSYPAGRALWVSSGSVTNNDVVLLYFHGGGYLAGSPDTHKKLVARLCRYTGFRAFIPSYRLAPEHPAPAGYEDGKLAWKHLLKTGYSPEQIILGGDSAGGGMALSILSWLCESGKPPRGIFAWSPFADQTFSGASIIENDRKDHFFPASRVRDLTDIVLGNTPAKDPRVSPIFAKFPGCPPVYFQASQCEILRDDAVRMGQVLESHGARVKVELWQDTPHVWQFFDGWFPEARHAIKKTADWIKAL